MQFIATSNVVLLRVHQLSRHRKFFTKTKTVENMYMQRLCDMKRSAIEKHRKTLRIAGNPKWKFQADVIFIGGDPIEWLAPQPAAQGDMPTSQKGSPPNKNDINPNIRSGFPAIHNTLLCSSIVLLFVVHNCYAIKQNMIRRTLRDKVLSTLNRNIFVEKFETFQFFTERINNKQNKKQLFV